MALPDDVPGGADAAMLVLRFCYDFDAVAEAVAVGGCGLPALAVAADFFGCDTLNRLASEAFAAELEGADVAAAAAALEQVCADAGVRLALARAGEVAGERDAIEACRATLAGQLADADCTCESRRFAAEVLGRQEITDCMAVLERGELTDSEAIVSRSLMVLEILNLAGDGQVMATKISLDVLGSLLALVDSYAVVGRTDRHVGLAVSIALAISTRPDLVDVCLDCEAAGEKMDCESNDPIEADDLSINALSKAADLLAAHLFLIINDDDDAGTHAEELAERLPVRMLGMVATRAATVPNFVKEDLPGIVVGLLAKMSRRQEFVAGSTNCIVDDVVQFINALPALPIPIPLEHRTLFMARVCDLVRLVALHGTDEGDRTTLCELIDFDLISADTIGKILEEGVLPQALIARQLLARREVLAEKEREQRKAADSLICELIDFDLISADTIIGKILEEGVLPQALIARQLLARREVLAEKEREQRKAADSLRLDNQNLNRQNAKLLEENRSLRDPRGYMRFGSVTR